MLLVNGYCIIKNKSLIKGGIENARFNDEINQYLETNNYTKYGTPYEEARILAKDKTGNTYETTIYRHCVMGQGSGCYWTDWEEEEA